MNEVFSFRFCWNICISQFLVLGTFLISHHSVENPIPQGLKNIYILVNDIPLPVYLLHLTLLLLTLKSFNSVVITYVSENWSCFCFAQFSWSRKESPWNWNCFESLIASVVVIFRFLSLFGEIFHWRKKWLPIPHSHQLNMFN